MIALSNTAHLYARPDTKTELVEFFTAVLGAKGRTVTRDYVHGPPEPMYAFEFSNGAVLSVEFTEDALDDQRARRAAWLELRTDDSVGLQRQVEELGLTRIKHPYTPFFYVQAPGGQVFRIVGTDDH